MTEFRKLIERFAKAMGLQAAPTRPAEQPSTAAAPPPEVSETRTNTAD